MNNEEENNVVNENNNKSSEKESVNENLSQKELDLAAEWGAALEESKATNFEDFNSKENFSEDLSNLDFLMDIPINLSVELGKTHIPIKNLMKLINGSVIELDSLAGEPLDVLVNGYLIAQGEVVVVNDKFGIRLTDIITPNERIKRLNMEHN